MSDLNLLAFLQNCVSDTAVEQTSLENLLWRRLLTAGFTVNASGVIGVTVPISVAFDPANLSSAVPVNKGGTALTSGTSGGVLGFTASGMIASSAALTANALVLGGGAGATPTPMASLGTTTTVLHGNAAGAPTFGAIVNSDIAASTIDLTAKVTGTLPLGNGGLGVTTLTNHGVVLGQGASSPVASSVGAANTALGGNTGADPTFQSVPAILGNQTANTVLAGPTSGGATTSAFRALGFADLPAQMRAGAFNAAVQSIANTTYTAVTFDSEDYDTASIHSTVSNTSRFTVPSGGDGYWRFYAVVGFTSANFEMRIRFAKNGTLVGSESRIASTFGNTVMLTLSWEGNLVATDYVEIQAYQASGGALNLGDGSNRQWQNQLQAERMT